MVQTPNIPKYSGNGLNPQDYQLSHRYRLKQEGIPCDLILGFVT